MADSKLPTVSQLACKISKYLTITSYMVAVVGRGIPQTSPCTHTCTRTHTSFQLSLSSQPHPSVSILCSLSFISPVKLYLSGSLLISPIRFSPPTLPPPFPPFLPPPGIYSPSQTASLLRLTAPPSHTLLPFKLYLYCTFSMLRNI